MKKILSLLLLVLPFICGAQCIAVLEFKPGAGVSAPDVEGLSSIFATYFHPEGYTLVERSQIDRVIGEQKFRRSSLTEQEMVKIGKILDLTMIVAGDVNVIMGEYNVDVRVLNVGSATICATEGATFVQGTYREGMKKLAETLAARLSQTQERAANGKQEGNPASRTYTKAELQKKGFRFKEDLASYASVDGVNGPALLQAFAGGESSKDSWGHTAKKLDKSWYISGNVDSGKMNGLMILFANGSEKAVPETYITYVCDGEVAYPLLYLNKGIVNYVSPSDPKYGKEYRLIGVQERVYSYAEYSTLWAERTPGFRRAMFGELMKIYGPEIGSMEFLLQGSDGNFDIEMLRDNFDSFMSGSSYISPVAWEDE